METVLVRARELSRIYPMGETRVTALDRVDLDLERGSFTVLQGSSGSGKTTLLSLLAGLDRPSSGTLQVGGQDLLLTNEREMTVYRRSSCSSSSAEKRAASIRPLPVPLSIRREPFSSSDTRISGSKSSMSGKALRPGFVIQAAGSCRYRAWVWTWRSGPG